MILGSSKKNVNNMFNVHVFLITNVFRSSNAKYLIRLNELFVFYIIFITKLN